MPRDKEKIELHIRQWVHNRSLIGLVPASHPDWIVTVAFYSAVHAMDAALAFEDVITWNHETRFEAIAGINRLAKARKLYHTLYDLSRKVRYSGDPNSWIAPGDIEAKVVRGHLLPIEKSIEGLLGQDLKLPPIDLSHLISVPK